MSTEKGKEEPRSERAIEVAVSRSGPETEAKRKGGVEPAKGQAERDWQDSAKESGD